MRRSRVGDRWKAWRQERRDRRKAEVRAQAIGLAYVVGGSSAAEWAEQRLNEQEECAGDDMSDALCLDDTASLRLAEIRVGTEMAGHGLSEDGLALAESVAAGRISVADAQERVLAQLTTPTKEEA